MDFNVIVTLGPANLKEDILRETNAIGPCIYRINGAHSSGADVPDIVTFVRGVLPGARVMVDLPGNKVRTANLTAPFTLESGKTISLKSNQVNFRDFYKFVRIGDKVLANDSIYTLEVQNIENETLTLLSHSNGILQNNKGLHVQGIHADIPFIFDRDLDLIKAAAANNVDILSLSFVRNAQDIRTVKNILKEMKNSKIQIFAKVETLSAVKNLGHIFEEVDVINVDRGDLSTDVGLYNLASYQERIIEASKRAGKQVYLATQFLKNMEVYPVPLIAEIIDLHKTVKSGISGIQLSEETAIGKYPAQCVKTVFTVYYNSFSA